MPHCGCQRVVAAARSRNRTLLRCKCQPAHCSGSGLRGAQCSHGHAAELQCCTPHPGNQVWRTNNLQQCISSINKQRDLQFCLERSSWWRQVHACTLAARTMVARPRPQRGADIPRHHRLDLLGALNRKSTVIVHTPRQKRGQAWVPRQLPLGRRPRLQQPLAQHLYMHTL